jgi:hypothetical protein
MGIKGLEVKMGKIETDPLPIIDYAIIQEIYGKHGR